MTDADVRDLIAALTVLAANYTAPDESDYLSGFRAGARSAYSDAIARLRDLLADAA